MLAGFTNYFIARFHQGNNCILELRHWFIEFTVHCRAGAVIKYGKLRERNTATHIKALPNDLVGIERRESL